MQFGSVTTDDNHILFLKKCSTPWRNKGPTQAFWCTQLVAPFDRVISELCDSGKGSWKIKFKLPSEDKHPLKVITRFYYSYCSQLHLVIKLTTALHDSWSTVEWLFADHLGVLAVLGGNFYCRFATHCPCPKATHTNFDTFASFMQVI